MTAQPVERNTLQRAWAVLRRPSGDQLESFPLEVKFGEVECRAALDSAGVRHLLIPCIDEAPELDPKPATLGACVRPLVFNQEAVTYLDISCSDASLHGEFDEVMLDLLEEIAGSSSPATVAATVLSRWRKLFRNKIFQGLGHEAKLGLFAELMLIRALLSSPVGFDPETWRGPLREPHDFELPSRCVEVKALSEEGEGFIVHGWDQLDTHDDRRLDLALVTVVPDPDGVSLSDLISEIRAATRPDLRAGFDARLVAAGWDPGNPPTEVDYFTLGPIFLIAVDDGVPRLTPAKLATGIKPDGISGLRYRVSLDSVISLTYGSSISSLLDEETE